jgi:ectoine hydroxylase-related dioxygenase (phytanoyl-CoA dioxygenase family)
MLTPEQLEAFDQEGCLVIEDLFTEDDLQPVKDEFSAVTEREAQRLLAEGKLSDLYADEPFETRMAKVAAEAPEAAAALQTRAHKGDALFAFLKHPKILDRVESLVGPDILCHASYNLHPRLPGGRTIPHQDAAYYLPDGDNTLIVACLIPLVDTSEENGCLWVARGRHKEGVLRYEWRDLLYMFPEEVPEEQREPLPTPAGSMVMFTSMLPHGSLVNNTDTVRWSMDLRYQAVGQPTGRWYIPGFVARCTSDPSLETPDCATWIEDVERVQKEADRQPDRPRMRWENAPKNLR